MITSNKERDNKREEVILMAKGRKLGGSKGGKGKGGVIDTVTGTKK
jgi:hypothetical protein